MLGTRAGRILLRRANVLPRPASSSRPFCAAAVKMSVTASDFAKSDEKLAADADFKKVFDRYSHLASEDALTKTVKALTEKKHSVKVCKTSKEAVEYLNQLIPDGSSVSNGGSTTLLQIGIFDALMARGDKINNLKGKATVAGAAGDTATYKKLSREGASADFFLSSVSAITQEGVFYAADASGTRISGWTAAGKLIIVAGTNKIVANDAEADDRLFGYQYKLESARVRVAFKIPGSMINNRITIQGSYPMDPRVQVVLIEESLGF